MKKKDNKTKGGSTVKFPEVIVLPEFKKAVFYLDYQQNELHSYEITFEIAQSETRKYLGFVFFDKKINKYVLQFPDNEFEYIRDNLNDLLKKAVEIYGDEEFIKHLKEKVVFFESLLVKSKEMTSKSLRNNASFLLRRFKAELEWFELHKGNENVHNSFI